MPVATVETKGVTTGTIFKHAENQYRDDRSPAGEPLSAFRRGVPGHFDRDEDSVSMTMCPANDEPAREVVGQPGEPGAGR